MGLLSTTVDEGEIMTDYEVIEFMQQWLTNLIWGTTLVVG